MTPEHPYMQTLPDRWDGWLAKREQVFKSPPLNQDLISAIRRIAPQMRLVSDEPSRLRWERDQNGSCWGEYDAVRAVLEKLSPPTKVLEIGPGLGRSAVFFARKLDWTNAAFHLYEGNGNSIPKYIAFAPRSKDSFCGNTTQLKMLLDFNGVTNVEVFDAKTLKLEDLPGPYDFVYSFYCVGFHWALEHFLADIAGLIHTHTLLIFTVPRSFGSCKGLEDFCSKLVPLRAAWPRGISHQLLLLSKNPHLLHE
jgi:SAM-dependent methyltransferase